MNLPSIVAEREWYVYEIVSIGTLVSFIILLLHRSLHVMFSRLVYVLLLIY